MAPQQIGIYLGSADEVFFKYHFYQVLGPASEYLNFYSDAGSFVSSNHDRKVACFQIPYPYTDLIETQLKQVYDSSDVVFIIGSELHPNTVDFIRRNDFPKICWFLCGKLMPNVNGRTFPFLDWFTTSIHFYKNVRPITLHDLDPYAVKPFMFDALLGRKKPHRDQAYSFINDNLPDSGIVTYINDYNINFKNNDNAKWQWQLTGLEQHENVQWTVDFVTYYGHRLSLSQVMPIDIYNQSAYSLVCETNYHNDYVFVTEKTVKPILARRLFITLGNRYTLEYLRELGFQTFDGIIDESYDAIENVTERHQAALAQLRWLCTQPQEQILERARSIIEHNFNLMYRENWYQKFSTPFVNRLLNR